MLFRSHLDLRLFYAPIEAREGHAGRPATDPKILVGLWLYATADGVGSARELAELCRDHAAYRWICGGVSVNHHLLAEFRVGHETALDELLSEREFQVFLRLAKGETIGHMADGMSLSVKTVSTYRTRVMEKMKLASNSDLTYYALKNGLIQ